MKRKIFSIAVVVILLACNYNVQALADDNVQNIKEDSGSGLKYTYISTAHTTLCIGSYGRAVTASAVYCSSDVDNVVISSYLQKYDSGWITVKHWRQTTYSNSGSMENVWYVASGYSYRVLTYFYAYNGDDVESTSLIAYDSY